MMKRRQFIGHLAIASGLLAQATRLGATTFQRTKSVILIHLRGGNDWYNTVVPYVSGSYYRARPNIACAPEEVIQIGDQYGIHPSLSTFAELYRAGQMQIINKPLLKSGHGAHSHDEARMAWHRQLAEALTESMDAHIIEKAQPLCAAPFSQQVHDTLQAISQQKSPFSVYPLLLDGFDTHAFQQIKHGELLASLNSGVRQLCQQLKAQSSFEDTLLIIYSEMGRSWSENNRKGTDHSGVGAMISVSGKFEHASISDDAMEVSEVVKGNMRQLMRG